LCFATLEMPFDGLINDGLGRVPEEAEEGGGVRNGALGLQGIDGEDFEEHGESAGPSGPRWCNRSRAVIQAAAMGQPCDRLRRDPHSVTALACLGNPDPVDMKVYCPTGKETFDDEKTEEAPSRGDRCQAA
jgi:hypothetical protein